MFLHYHHRISARGCSILKEQGSPALLSPDESAVLVLNQQVHRLSDSLSKVAPTPQPHPPAHPMQSNSKLAALEHELAIERSLRIVAEQPSAASIMQEV